MRFYIFFLLLLWVSGGVRASGHDKGRHRKHVRKTMVVHPDVMVVPMNPERALKPSPMFVEVVLPSISRWREGIDVSHYQGWIDWDQVADSRQISYVYLKATEGATMTDDTYRRNLQEIRRVGLRVGSYHFYRSNVPWREQFENLKRHVKKEEQDLVPIVDIEHRGRVSIEKFIRDLSAFLRQVERHYGKKPLLYTYQNFYNRYLSHRFEGYHWMIAKYQDEAPQLVDGCQYTMWQYTQSGSLPGIEGDVDRSRLVGDFELHHVGM